MVYVNIIGIAVLSVFVLFIVSKKNKVLSDYLLLLLIFFFFGILASGILLEYELTVLNYIVFLFYNSFIFPCFIIYGLVLLDPNQKFKITWLWTASYAIVFLVFVIIDTSLLNSYNTSAQLNALIESPSTVYYLFYKGQYLFVTILLLWFLRKLNKYRRDIKNSFSSIDAIHLGWFKNFTYIYLLVNIASLVLFVLLDLNLVSDIFIPLLIEHLILVLALFYLCFHGIKQYNLANLKTVSSNSGENGKLAIEKYSTSSLSEKEMRALFSQIGSLFENDRIYLDPELKIETIANRLEVGNHKISQTINTISKQSFYDFVNTYRVDHLKKLLKSEAHQKFTILALGLESGFNSKSSLNRIFKQQVGMSPMTYQKAQIIS